MHVQDNELMTLPPPPTFPSPILLDFFKEYNLIIDRTRVELYSNYSYIILITNSLQLILNVITLVKKKSLHNQVL